jgi:hypothetical protein
VAGFSSATWGSPKRAYSGAYDAFAAKLDGSGNLTWHTFLGSSGEDRGFSVAVDGSGNVYVSGYSNATWGSPKRAYTGDYDAFAAKLDGSGNLTWHTFVGGSDTDAGHGIAVDGSGNVYVGGYSGATWGSPKRAYTGDKDAFAAELDGSGNLTWNTFLGEGAPDAGRDVAVDGSGNVYVTGSSESTWGSPKRAYSGDNDAFAAELDGSGNLIWNTFLGCSGGDSGTSIAVDGSGNVYVTGSSDATWGSPKRAYTPPFHNAFAVELDGNGNLTWNTFLGGSGGDSGRGVAVDGSGNVYVAGYSGATWGSPKRAYTAYQDASVAKLDGSGNLIWNTFLGGSSTDFSYGIAVSGSGNAYVTGYSTATWGSPKRAYTAGLDALAAILMDTSSWEHVCLPLVVRNY